VQVPSGVTPFNLHTSMILRSFNSYLKHLTAEVRKHGRQAIEMVDDAPALLTGFRSPDGFWQIGLNTLKEEFSKGRPWRENTLVVETYKKLGGTCPLQAMTRVPPPEEFARLYATRVRGAIVEGERLGSMH